jgi:hypothetical protein
MRTFNHDSRLELARGQLWSRVLRGRVRISCESGVIWLTRSDDARDYLLNAGESIELCSDSHIVMQSLRGATARVEHRSARGSHFFGLRGLWPNKARLSTRGC